MAAGQGGGSNKEGANLLAFCYGAATEDEVLRPLMREGGEDKEGAATPLREQALRLRTPDGRTALHCAVQRRWLRLADALVGWGASPTEPGLGTSGNTPLHVAANTGEARMLKVLLASQHLSSTDVPNANGDSALMFACAGGHLGCASLLLAAGAAIGHTNSAGLGPLAIALGDGAASRPVLDLLLRHLEQCSGEEREAVLHAPSGQQVLHIAASAGQGDTVARLLRAGADPFRRNAAGRLPIEEAERAVPLRARSSNPTIVALREAMAERGEAAEAAAAALLRDDENPSQQPKRKIAVRRGAPLGTTEAILSSHDNLGEKRAAAASEDVVEENHQPASSREAEGMLEIGPVPEEQATDAVSSYEGTEPWQVVQPSWRRGKPGNASPAIPEEPRANPGQSILERMAPAVLQAEPVASSSRKSGAPLPDPLYAQYNAGTATQECTPASVERLASAQALLQQRHPKAAALEIEPMNVLGLGIEQLSMSQLEALEEIHLGELSRVADARVQLASQQKLAAHLEAAKLAREFREVLRQSTDDHVRPSTGNR